MKATRSDIPPADRRPPGKRDVMTWYYYDAAENSYHAIAYRERPRAWTVLFRLDPATGAARTWTGALPDRRTARRILQALAPGAVELPGLPAWMR